MTPKPKQNRPRKRLVWWATAVFAVAGAVAVTAMVVRTADDESDTDAARFLANLPVDGDDPEKMRETFREIMNRNDLTDEQRREAFRKLRESRRDMMRAFVEQFFAAGDEDKNAILDDHIAEMQERMAEWEKRRKEGDGPTPEEREALRSMFQSRTQAERKADSESRNPDETARTMAYFTALRARMGERGISMPRGPGRGGPWGGGPGGGGRGPRP